MFRCSNPHAPTGLGVVVLLALLAGCQSSGGPRYAEGQAAADVVSSTEMMTSIDSHLVDKPIYHGYAGQPQRPAPAQVAGLAQPPEIHTVGYQGDNQQVQGTVLEQLAPPEPIYPTSDLSLQEAIETSLTQNPDLIAARGQDQVSVAALGVAQTYIWNPFVQSQLRPPDGRGGQTNYYVWLMQRFELTHKQAFREQIAEANLNQVRWTIMQTELTNVSQTSRLYFAALYQQELFKLAEETAQLNEELLGVVRRRFDAGLGSAAQVTTAKVAARQSRNQARLADATYKAALLALRQQLNLQPSEPLSLQEEFAAFAWMPASSFSDEVAPSQPNGSVQLSDLAGNLVEGRPDVMAALSGASAAGANYRLAHAAIIPDVQAGPILDQNANGSSDVGVRLQMDLPVWNTGVPLARQRTAEWQQQSRVYNQLKIRAAREAETAIDRYERARRLAAESRVDLSPFSERMPPDLKEINDQFQAGQTDVLTVYATQNSLLQDRRTYLDLLNELAQSSANVIQATALPVERIVDTKGARSRP
ncbi:TolC family protein [bacterium]|nr:TolC family protein [bacterium]